MASANTVVNHIDHKIDAHSAAACPFVQPERCHLGMVWSQTHTHTHTLIYTNGMFKENCLHKANNTAQCRHVPNQVIHLIKMQIFGVIRVLKVLPETYAIYIYIEVKAPSMGTRDEEDKDSCMRKYDTQHVRTAQTDNHVVYLCAERGVN